MTNANLLIATGSSPAQAVATEAKALKRHSTRSNSPVTYRLVKIDGDTVTGFRGRPSVSEDAIKARLLKMKTDARGRYNAGKARNVKVQRIENGTATILDISDPRK